MGGRAWILCVEAVSPNFLFCFHLPSLGLKLSQSALHIDILLWCGSVLLQKTPWWRQVYVWPPCLHAEAKKKMRNSYLMDSSHVQKFTWLCSFICSFVFQKIPTNASQGPSSEPVALVAWCRVSEGQRTDGSYECRVFCSAFCIDWITGPLRYNKKSKIALARQKSL